MTKAKFLVVLFAIALLMLVFPNIVSAATIQATETTTTSTEKTVTWSYELDSNNNILNLKCTNISSIGGELTIPSTIDGYTVLTIGEKAFFECTGLTGITIPETVTTIGKNSFEGCTGLKNLTIPNSVTNIEDYAFSKCMGLISLTLSENLSKIGSWAFEDCTGLKTLTIPDSVTVIENAAFHGCAGLKELKISENLTKIDVGTFQECKGLTSVIIPNSVTTLAGNHYEWNGTAFRDCENLEKVLIPDSVATIEENVFYGCNKLTIYGNDGQASKTYAEENNINFKYISEWDEADVGDDITPPHVETIEVPYSNVLGYYDSNSTTYIVPSGKVLIINVNFNENILATEVPSLTIRFGSGSHIVLTEGTVSGSTVAYTYTIANGDVGTMAVVSLAGGNITDEAGNEATLSCPELKVQYSNHYIYANGTAIDVEDGNNNSNNNDNNNNNTNNNNTNNNQQPEENPRLKISNIQITNSAHGRNNHLDRNKKSVSLKKGQ